MDRKDLSISNDDLSDIFGGAQIAPAIASVKVPEVKQESIKKPVEAAPLPDISFKKEEPPKQAPQAVASTFVKPSVFVKESASAKAPADKPVDKAPEKSKLIMDRAQEAFRAQELAAQAQVVKKDENSVDDLIKRAQEIEKESAAPDLKFVDFIDEKTVTEMVHAFNDLKAAFAKELAGKIDQRAIDNMMLRTLEKTAVSFILLKNTSWDTSGELKQDGSIDAERLVKNMALYKEQIQEIDKEIEESLKALMFMRLSAVKKGLGRDKYAEIKNGLIRRSVVVEGGYRKAVAKFIIKNVMENSMKKADEEK